MSDIKRLDTHESWTGVFERKEGRYVRYTDHLDALERAVYDWLVSKGFERFEGVTLKRMEAIVKTMCDCGLELKPCECGRQPESPTKGKDDD